MVPPELRSRSATEIVDASFQILRAHYAQFVMCAAIAYSPLLLIQLLVVGDPGRFLGTASVGPRDVVVMAISSIAGWLTIAMMSAVLVVCASQAYLGEEVDVGAAVRRALPRTASILGAAALRYLLIGVGFFAFFVGTLYVVSRYFAAIPAAVLEGASAGGAMSRSSQLSRGRKWHVLNTLGLVGIIYLLLFYGLYAAASLIGNFTLQVIVQSTVTVLVYPVVAITEALLYYDARIGSEGFDVELMANALTPASAATER